MVFGVWNAGRAIVLGSVVLQLIVAIVAKANEWDQPKIARRLYMACIALPFVAFLAAAISHEI